jgi:hypothetical protein
MNTTKGLLAFLALLVAAATHSQAATVVLDSFTEGSVNLSDGFGGPDVDVLTTGLLQLRDVDLDGGGEYTATLVTGSGTLNYTVDLRGQPNGVRMTLIYQRPDQGLFSLIGTEGFSIHVQGIVGAGELIMFVNPGSSRSVSIPLNTAGELFYPVGNLGGNFTLDQLNQVGLHFIARSPDFSITLGEISAVPEPSGTVLFGLVASAGLFARRR